jgi:hypothetical protein
MTWLEWFVLWLLTEDAIILALIVWTSQK